MLNRCRRGDNRRFRRRKTREERSVVLQMPTRKKPSCLVRLLKWSGIALVCLVFLFWVAIGPWPVDRSSLEDTHHYKATMASVDKWLADSEEVSDLRVGAASAILEMPKGIPLAGYGARKGASSQGVHDPVRAKAVAVSGGGKTAAVVGADILLVNEPLAEEVARRVANTVPRDCLYFTATHTHSGPGGWGDWWAENLIAGDPSTEGFRVLAEGMSQAVEAAVAALAPATVAFGKALAPEFIRNRLVGEEGSVDPSLQVVRFSGAGGNTVACLVSYAAHATVLGDENLLLSAEYPGALERDLEKRWGGTALFCAGPMGSMSPRGGSGEGFAEAGSIGDGLATKAEALDSDSGLKTLKGPVAFEVERIPIVTPAVQYRVSENARLSPVLCRFALDFNRNVSLSVLRLGPLLMIGLPCELSGEIALPLYEYAERRGIHLVLTVFNGHYVGYVAPDKYYALDKYETRAMSFLGPHGGSFFESTVKGVVDRLAGG